MITGTYVHYYGQARGELLRRRHEEKHRQRKATEAATREVHLAEELRRCANWCAETPFHIYKHYYYISFRTLLHCKRLHCDARSRLPFHCGTAMMGACQ